MKDQMNLIIDDKIRKRLQRLKPDVQITNKILSIEGVYSSSQNISLSDMHPKSISSGSTSLKSRPCFEPPYDSPLEEIFAQNIIKYLDEAVIFQKKVSIDTLCGRFRLDFMIQRSEICIGLECDGEEYHCSSRDEWRDAMILETGAVIAIYRFRGKDIVHRIEDCLFFLAMWEPQFFLERGLDNLKVLASSEARKKIYSPEIDDTHGIFCSYEEYGHNYGVKIERHSYYPGSYIDHISSFAKQCGGGELDHVIQKFNTKYIQEF